MCEAGAVWLGVTTVGEGGGVALFGVVESARCAGVYAADLAGGGSYEAAVLASDETGLPLDSPLLLVQISTCRVRDLGEPRSSRAWHIPFYAARALSSRGSSRGSSGPKKRIKASRCLARSSSAATSFSQNKVVYVAVPRSRRSHQGIGQ